ncbi:hypothetical protein MASR2M48_22000 [Spirochaetota bacterium]
MMLLAAAGGLLLASDDDILLHSATNKNKGSFRLKLHLKLDGDTLYPEQAGLTTGAVP